MPRGFKTFLVALSALLFGIGHVACACAAESGHSAKDRYGEVEYSSGRAHKIAGADSHHGAGHGDGDSGAPYGPSDAPCEHCQLVQFAAAPDAAKLAAPAPTVPFIASLNAIMSPNSQQSFLRATVRLRWAAPPGATPVSLKTRLLN